MFCLDFFLRPMDCDIPQLSEVNFHILTMSNGEHLRLLKGYYPLLIFALFRVSCNSRALPSAIPFNDINFQPTKVNRRGMYRNPWQVDMGGETRNPRVSKGKSIFKSSVIEICFSS